MKRLAFRTALGGLAVCALSMIGATVLMNRAARGRLYSDVQLIPHRRVGLVLGCAPRLPNGGLNSFYEKRIRAAVALYRARKVDYLLVSGERLTGGYDEARDMKASLIAVGIPSDAIYSDSNGFRTLDSIVRAKQIFGLSEFTIISQNFHNQRAIFIGIHNGIDPIGFNAGDVDGYGGFSELCREQLARVSAVLDVFIFKTRPRVLGERLVIGADRTRYGGSSY
jgi:SanA protein